MAKTQHPTADTIPDTVPALPKAVDHNRHLPATAAFKWLALGWRDLWTRPLPSLVYGLGVALLSLLVIVAMVNFGWVQILFPALSGFLVVGPLLATGLYEKSRRLEAGEKVTLWAMLFPRRGGGTHLFFVGAILLTLMLVWMRAAVLLYALFFGWRPFPGFDSVIEMLFTTPTGLAMLATGTAVGGLFAAFAFAISAFSIPMMLDPPARCLLGHGPLHVLRLEQPARGSALGRRRAGLDGAKPGYGAGRADRHLPAARPRHLARLCGHKGLKP